MKKYINNTEWDAPYFIGDITSKIYCFPWCENGQKEQNITVFKSRKEVMYSGYLPCKNCCSILPHGSWQDFEQEIKLFVPKEFAFKENLQYLQRSPNECMYDIKDDKIYRILSIEQEKPLIEISADEEDNLVIRFINNTVIQPKWIRATVASFVREWFDLDTNLSPFYVLAEKDKLLHTPIKEHYGLRNMGIPDLFEALCWGILGQQINLTYAYTLKRRLVENFGKNVEWNGNKYWIFPLPQKIAKLTVEDLLPLKMTIKKCEYLIGVAQLMVNGKLTKQSLLHTNDHKKAEKLLVSIRGIGPWTANYVLMRCLRFPTAFPIDDVGLHNVIKLLTGSETKPTKKEIKEYATTWTNWESYATFYLWRTLY
ncbi:DNA glycosylase [Bacillus toyonensis]|uniref:DNA glycosylase n=1 Tax=Bacillus toyonensis TaxID=155322 RepID=UPI000BF647B6|nr:DNA glycosylase [Bacillus toyonensis]PGC89445.1 DNA-3-methyladenine glycosylase [Bacillus toyonensis]